MKNILIVVENPSIANEVSKHNSCSCIQPIFSMDTCVSVAENSLSSCGYENNENGLVPLELNFFKDAKDAYVVLATSDKVDCDAYDYILFATKKTDTAFYGIVEFCERNNVLIDKILYKEHSFDTEEDYNNVMDIEGVQYFFDMSIDDFVA
jgi:hypothetical protein